MHGQHFIQHDNTLLSESNEATDEFMDLLFPFLTQQALEDHDQMLLVAQDGSEEV